MCQYLCWGGRRRLIRPIWLFTRLCADLLSARETRYTDRMKVDAKDNRALIILSLSLYVYGIELARAATQKTIERLSGAHHTMTLPHWEGAYTLAFCFRICEIFRISKRSVCTLKGAILLQPYRLARLLVGSRVGVRASTPYVGGQPRANKQNPRERCNFDLLSSVQSDSFEGGVHFCARGDGISCIHGNATNHLPLPRSLRSLC